VIEVVESVGAGERSHLSDNRTEGRIYMHSHKESFVNLENLGMVIPKYRPTFDFLGEFINESQKNFATCPSTAESPILIELRTKGTTGSVIQGWLRREDAQKLYELAYFVTGDILELGAYHGLSTSILSRANIDSPLKKHIYCVELDADAAAMTQANLTEAGLEKDVTVLRNDALSALREFASEGKKFEFVFVDHSHTYEAVYTVCREFNQVLLPGAFCLFHDFNDARNRDNNREYGVYQAIIDGLPAAEFEFYGVYGCAALYRYKI
jgi:predicted O-methyltransferase YrrM